MWWIDRWRQSDAFARMTAEEQGLYRNLCDEVVLREDGIIPDDARILAKASGDHEAWARSGKSVLKSMTRVPGGWTNETALAVRKESERRSKDQSEKGKLRANGAEREGGKFSRQPAEPPAGTPAAPPAEAPADQPAASHPPYPYPYPYPEKEKGTGTNGVDAAKAKAGLLAALQAFRQRLPTDDTDQSILDRPEFHSRTGPVRLDTCTNSGLMFATAGKLRAHGKPKARKAGAPAWDQGDADQAELTSRAEAWIEANWPHDCDPKARSDLDGLMKTLSPPEEITQQIWAHLLFGKYPNLRGPKPVEAIA